MRIDVVSIFPDYLAPLDMSLIGKAQRDGLVAIARHDLRDFTHDRHRTVDDTPYGGGAGMVMRPEPWSEALAHVRSLGPVGGTAAPLLVVPGPSGEPFTQRLAHELALEPWLAFACGRYEGIDERVYEEAAEHGRVRVVSLGDYVLNGGEVAVMAMTEAIVRLVPGVVGNPESLVEESHEDGLLEYPVYTKPAVFHGRAVPDVLLSGNHAVITAWRHEQRLRRTAERRPDLLAPIAVAAGAGLPPGSVLRPAAPGDVGELLTLTHACWLHEGLANRRFDIPAMHETLESLRASLDEWETWVLRFEGRLVASARGRLDGETWDIGRVMAAPDLWGRGLGRAMLEHVLARAPQGARRARLHTGAASERNLRMYRRAGFRLVDRDESMGAVVLERTIGGR